MFFFLFWDTVEITITIYNAGDCSTDDKESVTITPVLGECFEELYGIPRIYACEGTQLKETIYSLPGCTGNDGAAPCNFLFLYF